MRFLALSVERLAEALLELSKTEQVCLLDSCGVSHLQSRFLLAGIKPLEIMEISEPDSNKTLEIFEREISKPDRFSFFTIAYDFGLKTENIKSRPKEFPNFPEPDIFLAVFDVLILHDYQTAETFLIGNEKRFDEIEDHLLSQNFGIPEKDDFGKPEISSNFTKDEYISTIEKIQELIREGETYQTNLTQQFRVKLPDDLTPQVIFRRLRKSHPAPFSAFIKRKEDYVVSISPERFFRVEGRVSNEKRVDSEEFTLYSRLIKTSPIKGTRPRGKTAEEDSHLRNELLNSQKDRAENTMIVDLLRNDIGRVCEFGSVSVEKLCDLEEHPTLFHLVSTVSGHLRPDISYSEIILALFPCGSITGCPKIRTMQIIDELETVNRGLSMGAIGYSIADIFKENSLKHVQNLSVLELSVAIRTMVIRENEAVFNVGGGIVIDSNPAEEYEESLVKAKALFKAIGATEF